MPTACAGEASGSTVLAMLVVVCPCALVISTPVSNVSGPAAVFWAGGGPGRGRAVAGAAGRAAGDDPRSQGAEVPGGGIVSAMDQLPNPQQPDEGHDGNLLYVDLTRATDELVVTWTGRSAFTDRVLRSNKAIPLSDPDSARAGPSRVMARISSKAAAPAESRGKVADWRCIRAHFPVSNQIIP